MWIILIQQSVELVDEGAPATEHLGATQLGTTAPLSNIPASSCHATKEDLLNAKFNVINVCPLCKEFGVRCYVGSHPLQVSGKRAPLSMSQYNALILSLHLYYIFILWPILSSIIRYVHCDIFIYTISYSPYL